MGKRLIPKSEKYVGRNTPIHLTAHWMALIFNGKTLIKKIIS